MFRSCVQGVEGLVQRVGSGGGSSRDFAILSVQNKKGSNERFGNKRTDLENLLISLLMEKPQGMSIKVSIRPVPVFNLCGINGHRS